MSHNYILKVNSAIIGDYLHKLLHLWVRGKDRLKSIGVREEVLHHWALHHLLHHLRVALELLCCVCGR